MKNKDAKYFQNTLIFLFSEMEFQTTVLKKNYRFEFEAPLHKHHAFCFSKKAKLSGNGWKYREEKAVSTAFQ